MDVKLAALIWTEMVSAGLVPLTTEMINQNRQTPILALLEGLTPDEQVALRRKFRKVWRSMRFESRGRVRRRVNPRKLRIREGEPTADQLRKRKRAVLQKFYLAALKVLREHDPFYGAVQF